MIGFELQNAFNKCPIYWQNFIISVRKEFMTKDVATVAIHRELKKYGGRWHFAGSFNHDTIEFASEECYTMFILRWS